MKTYTGLLKNLKDNQIFVFGSNPEGRHGMGTANIALKKYKAVYGQGRGLQGMSYGLVTKNLTRNYKEPCTGIIYDKAGYKSVSGEQIISNIKELYAVAESMSDYEFLIAYTAKNFNLNGYSCCELAQFFRKAGKIPRNIVFNYDFINSTKPKGRKPPLKVDMSENEDSE